MKTISVLIIEDDRKISELHKRFTEQIAGFSVVDVANTIADGRMLNEVYAPNLILLDIYFPDGNGIDLLWELRRSKHDVDIILITAATEIEPLREAMRGGVFDYILKPVAFARFKETLLRYQQARDKLNEETSLDQHHVDALLKQPLGAVPEAEFLPKGIDAITLARVRGAFTTADIPSGLTSEEVSAKTGISRSTARRYLEYLAESGWLKADLVYGTVGRPERKYFRS